MATLRLATFLFLIARSLSDTSDRRLPAYITGNRHGPGTDALNKHDTNQLNGHRNAQPIAAANIVSEPDVVEHEYDNVSVEYEQQQGQRNEGESYQSLEDEIEKEDEEIEELREELEEHELEEAIEEEIRDEEMAYYAYDNFERGYDDGYNDGSYYNEQPHYAYGLSFMHFMIVGFCLLGTCAACYLGAGGCIMAGYYAGKQGYMKIDGDDDEKEALVVETKE